MIFLHKTWKQPGFADWYQHQSLMMSARQGIAQSGSEAVHRPRPRSVCVCLGGGQRPVLIKQALLSPL